MGEDMSSFTELEGAKRTYHTIYISYRFSLSNIIISMGEDMSSFTELEGAKRTYHTTYIYPTGFHSATLSLVWVKI